MNGTTDYHSEKQPNGHHASGPSSPVVPRPNEVIVDDKVPPIVYERDNIVGPGLLRDDVYESHMGSWRAGLRRALLRNLVTESDWLGRMQKWIRTPFLDTYFVYTSTLGTHTFFMTMLPAFFFFGQETAGGALIDILGVGVYLSSLIKDSVCSPRPFAPPVTRLSVGTHHLEYGFPSTHSTNSVSIALYFWSLVYSFYTVSIISPWTYSLVAIGLSWYVFSIVFGRLYCGMHSFTDCLVGSTLGAVIWGAHWYWGPAMELWIRSATYQVPLLSILLCLVLVHVHPDPVDDCPCFEDSIAFLAVIMGRYIAAWWRENWGYTIAGGYFQTPMPADWPMWIVVATAKMVIGVFIVFTWRLAAKAVLHALLPRIFRFLSFLFGALPNRRFYTPATDYKAFPERDLLYDPIPSVIDLPALGQNQDILLPVSRGAGTIYGSHLRSRLGDATSHNGHVGNEDEKSRLQHINVLDQPKEHVKHYDADVLTKVVVYAGIGFLATGLIPILFEYIGLPVYLALP